MSKPTQQQLIARDMSEAELQECIIGSKTVSGLAPACGWTVRHAWDSRGQNLSDLPDLLLIRPPRIVWMELKSQRGKLTPGQAVMIEMLLDCHQEVCVIRPRDWLSGRIEQILR